MAITNNLTEFADNSTAQYFTPAQLAESTNITHVGAMLNNRLNYKAYNSLAKMTSKVVVALGDFIVNYSGITTGTLDIDTTVTQWGVFLASIMTDWKLANSVNATTPLTCSGSTTNSKTTNGHTHEVDFISSTTGFEAGLDATVSSFGGAVGRGSTATTGGAIGYNSKETLGGGAVGTGATATNGGAVGSGAKETDTGGAVGLNASATSGGAVGSSASATSGGAVGSSASATSGGAVGSSASATSGGAVGLNTSSENGGFAGGENANETGGGGAIGYGASTTSGGGAVGWNSSSTNGFAGGYLAKATASYSVQLGTGTNNDADTIQFGRNKVFNADLTKLEPSTANGWTNITSLTGTPLNLTGKYMFFLTTANGTTVGTYYDTVMNSGTTNTLTFGYNAGSVRIFVSTTGVISGVIRPDSGSTANITTINLWYKQMW